MKFTCQCVVTALLCSLVLAVPSRAQTKAADVGSATTVSAQHYDCSADKEAIRQKNLATVKQYFASDHAGRSKLFAKGAVFEQTFPFYGDTPTRMAMNSEEQPPPQQGSQPPQAGQQAPQGGPPAGEEQLELTIDWKYRDQTIYLTDDPNYIMVENYGSGKQLFADGEYKLYSNHYIHTFRFENGLIKEYREITNPLNLYKAFGLALPHMPTPDETMKGAIAARASKNTAGK